MNTKTAISILTAGVCALAVQQASANPFFTDTETATITGSTLGHPSFTLTTTVTEATMGSDYDYTYSFSSGTYKLNSFTVEGVNAGTFDTTGVNTVTSLNPNFSETVADIIANGQATWGSSTRVAGAESFSFFSPLPPIPGTAFAEDGQQFLTAPAGSPNSLVPGSVPDGGLTVALLGGAMTAMTLIRRKVS